MFSNSKGNVDDEHNLLKPVNIFCTFRVLLIMNVWYSRYKHTHIFKFYKVSGCTLNTSL